MNWNNNDFNKLEFILAEYLGLQAKTVDETSLQELHNFVHRVLDQFWKVEEWNKKNDS